MNSHPAPKTAGFTLAELAFGLLIFVIIAVVLINHLTVNYQTTLAERDRVFAYGKAQAILSEIQGFVDRGQIDAAVDLDVLDDGVTPKPTLTLTTDASGTLVLPDHPLSNNIERNGQWLWSRRITVQPFSGLDNRNVRYVTVRVFKKDSAGRDLAVADLSAVINSAGAAYPTTQVFDIYLLAIENIPGWWVYMDSIRPFVESTITDLETRNPGLEVRTHWITKSAFGRNPVYRPYVNEALDSRQAIDDVYCYPGRMPAGEASTYYYVPGNIKGHIELDGSDAHGYDDVLNPYPYALADYYNHAMRYPDELALWQARVREVELREQAIAAARAAGTPPPAELDDMSKEPTWRLFLDDLNSHPDKYRNALIINLHGELLPMPPMRNYSDPAREPVTMPEVRVVTHPEELRTARNAADPGTSDPVKLRIYAFNTNTQTYTTPAIMPRPMAVDVVGVDLTEGGGPRLKHDHQLQCLRGGVPVGPLNDTTYQNFAPAKVEGEAGLLSNEMYYRAEQIMRAGIVTGTRILLFNTPVVAPPVATRGLNNDERSQLYWMSYVPCATEAAQDFSRNLYTTGAGPKNTARWTLTISPTCLTDNSFEGGNPAGDVTLQVKTRIWTGSNPETAGTMWPPMDRNMPENLSSTYTWWASSPDAVPITERAQFLGDPRHCPYKDNLKGGVATNLSPDYPNGYNWFFDALNNSSENSRADYPGLNTSNLLNRWRGSMNLDIPRLFEVIRKGLVTSKCLYTSLTGWSYYYVGIGNDIGYDSANGYPNSIPVHGAPFGSTSSSFYLDTITGSKRLVRAGGAGYWWGITWLGELSPDSVYSSQWMAADGAGNPRGNLDPGTTAGHFYQATANSVYSGSSRTAYGTSMLDSLQRTASEGCTSFFNVGSSASTFHHRSSTGNGTLVTAGLQIGANYNFTMPVSAPISRPFAVATNTDGTVGDEYSLPPYSTARYSASLFKTYYNHPTGATGSGLVKLSDPTGTSSAYVVVNGIDRTVESGSSFIAKFAVLSLVHSFFESGVTTNTNRIKQPPRVEITSPTDISELNNPASINVQYDVHWTRWDGLPYTSSGSYSESEAELEYAVLYSRDGGISWLYADDDSPAKLGERPADPGLLHADAVSGTETFSWSTPMASFPEGSYLVLVECFRIGSPIHFSYHKAKFFIAR